MAKLLFGNLVVDALRTFKRPATLDEVAEIVATKQSEPKTTVKKVVQEALSSGVRHGIVKEINENFYSLTNLHNKGGEKTVAQGSLNTIPSQHSESLVSFETLSDHAYNHTSTGRLKRVGNKLVLTESDEAYINEIAREIPRYQGQDYGVKLEDIGSEQQLSAVQSVESNMPVTQELRITRPKIPITKVAPRGRPRMYYRRRSATRKRRAPARKRKTVRRYKQPSPPDPEYPGAYATDSDEEFNRELMASVASMNSENARSDGEDHGDGNDGNDGNYGNDGDEGNGDEGNEGNDDGRTDGRCSYCRDRTRSTRTRRNSRPRSRSRRRR